MKYTSTFRNWKLPFLKREKTPAANRPAVQKWPGEEVTLLSERLAQVISWTGHLISKAGPNDPPALILRQTNPVIYGSPLYDFQDLATDGPKWSNDIFNQHTVDYPEMLRLAIQARPAVYASIPPDFPSQGRILTFETDITTICGGPVAESKGFVDIYDIPPIDTWFYLKNNYVHKSEGKDRECTLSLFCWIPKACEPLMQSAIDVEILDSYRWLDENDRELYEKLVKSY